MDHIYGNVDVKLSKNSGNKKYRRSTDVSDRGGQSASERDPLYSKDTLKFLLAALGFLLLCALVALCVLGILYYSEKALHEALSEQYSSAVARLSVQEHNATELKSHLDQVLMIYENTSQCLESFEEIERKFEALKVKYRTTYAVISNCSECQKCALCGEGWRLFGVKCYYVSSDKLNWTMSRDHCAQKGGHLVIITSRDEQDFVSSSFPENHWIGLNDLETEGKWMWVNNRTLAETGVTFWYERSDQPNEPDNWTEEDPSGENCAKLDSDKWFDASCRELKKYICEKKSVSL